MPQRSAPRVRTAPESYRELRAGVAPDLREARGMATKRTVGIAMNGITGRMGCLLYTSLYGLASYPSTKERGIAMRSFVLCALAMAASDVPATMLEVTNPAEWGTSGWLSDIVPHLAYGVVTAAVFETIAT